MIGLLNESDWKIQKREPYQKYKDYEYDSEDSTSDLMNFDHLRMKEAGFTEDSKEIYQSTHPNSSQQNKSIHLIHENLKKQTNVYKRNSIKLELIGKGFDDLFGELDRMKNEG